MRRPLPIVLLHRGRVPVRAAVFPRGEPELLRRAVHVLEIVRTRVADKRLEAIAVSRDPVHHVAAVRSAGRAHACAVEPRRLHERGVEPEHQIRIHGAAPILRDRVDELLPVPGRAARIDDHDAVSLRREHLVAPASVPLVEPRHLRPAVNQQHDGKLLSGRPLRRTKDHPLHAVAAGALEPVVLHRIHLERREQRVVRVRELLEAGHAGAERGREHFGGAIGGVLQPRDRAPRAIERRRRVVALGEHELRRARNAVREGGAIELLARCIDGLDEKRVAVGDEGVAVRVAIPRRQQLARLMTRAIVRHEPPAIRLEARAQLRVIEDELSVGRVHRIFIGPLVPRRDHVRRAAGRRNRVEIVVGAPRVFAPGVLRGVRELLPVGRPRVAFASAEWSGRHVVHRAGREIEQPVAVGADGEQMRARAVVPCIPVAIHQRIGNVRLHRTRRRRLHALERARVIRARREHARRKGDPLAARRPHGSRRTAGERRELLARAAHLIGNPELIARDVRHTLPVRRPTRLPNARGRIGERRGRAAARRDLVRHRGSAVRREIRRSHREEHAGAARRYLRIGDRLHRLEAFDSKGSLLRLFLRGERRGAREERGGKEKRGVGEGIGHSSVLSGYGGGVCDHSKVVRGGWPR